MQITNNRRAAWSIATAAAFGTGLSLAGAAWAGGSLKDEPEPPKREHTLSANFSVTTDYMFRGFSQSAGNPVVQGGVDFGYKWFYAGIWASGIDFGNDLNRTGARVEVANVEVDYYAGIKPEIMGITFDVGVIYYTYPNAFDRGFAANRELDYLEIKLGMSRTVWKGGTLASTLFLSPNYTNDTGFVWTSESTFSQELHKIRDITPTFSATLGYQGGDDRRYAVLIGNGDDNYYYWNAGLSLGFADRLTLDFRYWDTNISNAGGFCRGPLFQCDARFVATAKITY